MSRFLVGVACVTLWTVAASARAELPAVRGHRAVFAITECLGSPGNGVYHWLS